MKTLKHKKIKNTWLLFDVLTRKVVNELFIENKSSNNVNVQANPSFKLIDKYFADGTDLNKELALYKCIIEGVDNTTDVNKFINLLLESHKNSINCKSINEQKYQLFGEAKVLFENDGLDINIALQSNVDNYKLIASIYSIFEYNSNSDIMYNIEQFMDSKKNIYDYMTKNDINENSGIEEYKKLDEASKLLTYKILVEKFNTKYKDMLNNHQKNILKQYVNSVYDSVEFNNFVFEEFKYAISIIDGIKPLISDIHKIKLQEIKNQFNSILDRKLIKECYVLALLNTHKLFGDIDLLYQNKI